MVSSGVSPVLAIRRDCASKADFASSFGKKGCFSRGRNPLAGTPVVIFAAAEAVPAMEGAKAVIETRKLNPTKKRANALDQRMGRANGLRTLGKITSNYVRHPGHKVKSQAWHTKGPFPQEGALCIRNHNQR